jgi:hypothetical protein
VVLEPLRKQNDDDTPVFGAVEVPCNAEIPACRAAVSNRSWRFLSACLFCFLLLRLAIPPPPAKQTPHQRAMITTRSTQNTSWHGKSNFVVWREQNFSTQHPHTSLAAAVKRGMKPMQFFRPTAPHLLALQT